MKLEFDRIENTFCLECNNLNGTMFSMLIDSPDFRIPIKNLGQISIDMISFVGFHYKCLNKLIERRIRMIKIQIHQRFKEDSEFCLKILNELDDYIKTHKQEIEAELSILSLK